MKKGEMESMKQLRRSLEESLASFTLGDGGPPFPDHHAGIAREGDLVDITFFRGLWDWDDDGDFSNLTLPRRFMNRTTFRRMSFVNTDLNQSFMCWNDFIECDFTDADLTCCDMRESIFRNCKFVRCRLIGADLQRSSFAGCDFTGADLTGARVDDCTTDTLEVSEEQDAWLEYTDNFDGIGPRPKGG
jgi:uncharacterized protein YjbI with pentapeptide repeats